MHPLVAIAGQAQVRLGLGAAGEQASPPEQADGRLVLLGEPGLGGLRAFGQRAALLRG